jgi:diguanylate cyclase (GGDEF)-like protein
VTDNESEVVPLRPRSAGIAAAYRSLLELVVEQMTAAFPDDEEFGARAACCRAALRDAGDASGVSAAGDILLRLVAQGLGRARQNEDTRGELLAVIAGVRDAITAVAAGDWTFRTDLQRASERLAQLQRLPSTAALKSNLAIETEALRALTTEREANWRRALATFERRIATLEGQLGAAAVPTRDPLTGLPNRAGLAGRFAQSQLHPRPLAVVAIDLDDFGSINDTHGRARGDAVLLAVSRMLESSIRPTDAVGRLGADEFAMLLWDVTGAQAERRVRGLQQAIDAELALERSTSFGFSCGLVECLTEDTFASVMQRAEQALHRAKQLGRGRIVSA